MTAAELVVKIQADISDLSAKLGIAAAEVKAFADDTQKSGSKMKNAWRDAETGMLNYDRAQKNVRNGLNNGPLGLVGALGDAVAGVLKLADAVQRGAIDFGNWLQNTDQGATAMTGFGAVLVQVAPFIGVVGLAVIALVASLELIPIAVGLAIFLLTALADAIGTLAAVIYFALGPLTVLLGVIGLLGAAFVLSGKKAIAGKGVFAEFGKEVKDITGMFQHLLTLLGIDFMPIFLRLADAAKQAILYFDKLAKMPLADAMHSLATTGMQMLAKFLYAVGHALAQPFRMLVQFAFGQGGASANSQIHGLMSSLGGYLFGTTGTSPMHRGAAHGAVVNQGSVAGALQPILTWFNSHNFTKYGVRWGHEIMNGFLSSGLANKLGTFLLTVLADAGKAGAIAFLHAQEWVFYSAFPRIIMWILVEFQRLFDVLWNGWVHWSQNVANAIQSGLGKAWSWIKTAASAAWNAVLGVARRVWNTIVSMVENAMTVHINWPSPPGWLSTLAGIPTGGASIGAMLGNLIPHAAGGIITRPLGMGGHLFGEAGPEAVIPLSGARGRAALAGMGGHVTIVNINNPTFMSGGRPAARELARVLKPELDRIVRAR